jgi:hypothetical protein
MPTAKAVDLLPRAEFKWSSGQEGGFGFIPRVEATMPNQDGLGERILMKDT